MSVTYGAGGSTRQRTLELVKRLKRETEVEAMAHLTCVGASREELAGVLDEIADAGIQNVLALRGDPPRGQASFTPHPDGFRYASELVAFIRSRPDRWRFCVGAAAYPEGHVETRDLAADLANLKIKVDAGADFLVTQLFFENAHYFRFVERARAAGHHRPDRARHHALHERRSDGALHGDVRRGHPAAAARRDGGPARPIRTPPASLGWRTRACSAPTSCVAARRASTSTR